MSGLEQGNSSDAIFLRLPAVKALTGLSKSSLYALIRAKSFPAPIHLGPRTAAWLCSEVKEWAEERVLASRSIPSQVSGKRRPQSVSSVDWDSSRKWA